MSNPTTNPQHTESRRESSGFALVDLIGGLSILLIAIGGVYGMALQGANERRSSAQESLAFEACRIKLEELRATPFALLPAEDGTRFDVDIDGNGVGDLTPVPGNTSGMPGVVQVTTETTAGSETIYRVRVEVAWDGLVGTRTRALETLMTNRFGQ